MRDKPAEVTEFEDYAAVVGKFPTTPVANEKLGTALLYSSGTTGARKVCCGRNWTWTRATRCRSSSWSRRCTAPVRT